MLGKIAFAFAVTFAAATPALAQRGLNGVWMLNDTHTFYLQEDLDGNVSGSVLLRDNLNYRADIQVSRSGPNMYSGMGHQWYAEGGCVESYYATYTLLNANKIRVNINGSTGACGVPPGFRMSYDIRRETVRQNPLAGSWVLGNTHRWLFTEDFGVANAIVQVPSIPGFRANVELFQSGPWTYEGTGVQSMNGCTEAFDVRYALINASRVRVMILGSDGACGTPHDFKLTYDIGRGR